MIQVDRMTAIIAEIPISFSDFSIMRQDESIINDLLPKEYRYGSLPAPLADAWMSVLQRLAFLYPTEFPVFLTKSDSTDSSSTSGAQAINLEKEINPIGHAVSEDEINEDLLLDIYDSLLSFKAPLPGEPGAMKPSRPEQPKKNGSSIGGGRPVITKPRG